MTDYTPIITRLQAATGADRELDAHIGVAIRTDGDIVPARAWAMAGDESPGLIMERSGAVYASKPYTASIDAALALVKEKLGGHIGPIGLVIAGSAQVIIEDVDPLGWLVQAFGNTPPIAILLALFQALQEKES